MREDELRNLFQQEAKAIPVRPMTWAEIERQGVRRRDRRENRSRRVHKAGIGFVAGLAVVGALATSGFVSPAMAEVLHQIPGVGSLYTNYAKQQEKLATPVSTAPATASDVGFKVTRAFYDKNRLVVYYTLTLPDKDVMQAPSGTGDARNGQLWPQLKLATQFLSVKGKPVQFNSMLGDGEKKMGANTYSGSFDVEGITTQLPAKVVLDITAEQIGTVKGKFTVHVPVSSATTDAKTTTYKRVVSKTDANGATLTVKQVAVGPLNTAIDYEVTQPVQGNTLSDPVSYDLQGFQFGVWADGQYLQEVGGGIPQSRIEHGKRVDDMQIEYVTPSKVPTSIQIRPTYSNIHASATVTPVTIPLTGQFPIAVDQGNDGVSEITKITFQKNQTIVYDQLSQDSLEHFPIWFEDANGHQYKDTVKRTSDGGLIFPPMDPNKKLTLHTQKSSGDDGRSHPLTGLNMTVPLK
ncbi:DUF4179 domain-containing protein [Alicyclobacillus dauci]|uniref:DUF4179 domain-containing protein n=1 Tax=Alicyclobacillus dauci TaxID=1475485 RepID=A0ABY6Z3L3_9BACL|nr:DUF4179 domain-containing protein [Alicyclobacillus dauci]WAH37213.1 DUF4179 domain-containing protein [Alicyclobacillus dauci]